MKKRVTAYLRQMFSRIHALSVGVMLGLTAVLLLTLVPPLQDWRAGRLVCFAEAYLAEGDAERAVLMAEAAISIRPQHARAREALISAYAATDDPRIVQALEESEGQALQRTLKAMEFGAIEEAKNAYALLECGVSVDVISYHEMGAQLFRDQPDKLYEHCLALADATPHEPRRVLQLGYTCLLTNDPVPLRYVEALKESADTRMDDVGADAAAVLWLAMTRSPNTDEIELTTSLIDHMTAAQSLRPAFLRVLEIAVQRKQVEGGIFGNVLQDLCERLGKSSETVRLAMCLTRLQLFEELVSWYEEGRTAFPDPESAAQEAALARLLVADAAAQLGRWDVVGSSVSASAGPDAWGDYAFLRDFYGIRSLVRCADHNHLGGRELDLTVEMKMKSVSKAAAHQWKREMMKRLEKKYPLPDRWLAFTP